MKFSKTLFHSWQKIFSRLILEEQETILIHRLCIIIKFYGDHDDRSNILQVCQMHTIDNSNFKIFSDFENYNRKIST